MSLWLARLRSRPDRHPGTSGRRPPWRQREVAEFRDVSVSRSDVDGLSQVRRPGVTS